MYSIRGEGESVNQAMHHIVAKPEREEKLRFEGPFKPSRELSEKMQNSNIRVLMSTNDNSSHDQLERHATQAKEQVLYSTGLCACS